jgi:hypothetical protein
VLGICAEKYSIPWGKYSRQSGIVWGISAEFGEKSEISNNILIVWKNVWKDPLI